MIGLAQIGFHNAAAALGLMPFAPPDASSMAGDVDRLYYLLTGITVFFSVLIFSIIFYFMIKYRRRSEDEVPPETHTSMALELTWTIIPSLICVVLFVWASALYVQESRPPASATEIFVIGKQWMWHLQHPEGPREINELHVPVNVPVKITLTSQDVIHDFFVPAFRVKKDALPGRYTSLWFDPTKIGKYHLFCAQYCGTNHGEMIGWVYVMSREGLRGLACERREDRVDGSAGRASFHAIRLHRVPHGLRHGPRAIALGTIWTAREACERRDARCGRDPYTPGDSRAQFRPRAELPADHAYVSRPVDRRTDS